jgi:hypothetical protein
VSLVSHVADGIGRGSVDLARKIGHDGRPWLMKPVEYG